MSLNKVPLNINFSQGLDTKTDPFQVQAGKFLSLQNSVFDKGGQLKKRNGFGQITTLPNGENAQYLTTFNGNLTALGTNIDAYSAGTSQWVNKGNITPLDLTVLPAVRGSTFQNQADSVSSNNGLTCIVYTDNIPSGGGTTPEFKYTVIDSVTGQVIVSSTLIPNANSGARVFILGNYFIIMYTTKPSGYNLVYISISINNPTIVSSPVTLASNYTPSSSQAFDGIVYNNTLFFAYNTVSGGQSVRVASLTSTLNLNAFKTYAGSIGTLFSLSVDSSNLSVPIIYVSFYDSASTNGYVLAVGSTLNPILSPTMWASGAFNNITSIAQNGSVTIYAEAINSYGYDSSLKTNFIEYVTISQTGSVGSFTVLLRSLGLASKAFVYNGTVYMLGLYVSQYQSTYFLFNTNGQIVAKLAYSNTSSNYYVTGLPNFSILDSKVYIAYLYVDFIEALNTVNNSQQTTTGGIYSQLGVNIVTFDFAPSAIITSEIGQNLNYTGGYVSMYDGSVSTEQGFFLWPDNVEVSTSTSGGNITAQQYYYQVTYEWNDNQGNTFRSAPSIPVTVTTTGSTSSNTIHVPTLRLTYKTQVKVVIYRWSAANQLYYQVTSITSPLLSSPIVDFVSFVDTLSDSSIVGNNIIYTTGGVIEDISPPASDVMTLFNNRLWVLDAEDRNLLWFSKQVIEATPVEMSDLLTIYVAPTTASEGSTGPITAMAPMDDKLIIFKQNALGYINGIGPDNTGSNNQYSDFTLINSVVGCIVQNSIVFTPQGLMFQSNKGIWLLGRDLSTQYIGAPVESLTTGATVLSALNIPATNQVRFALDSNVTLFYDYYYAQWGTFTNIPDISSTIYQGLHTFVDQYGRVFQETDGEYLDGSSPVLMSFTTSWINLGGIQNFERFYYMLLLGQYISPFSLDVKLAYDYNSSNVQSITVTPSQVPSTWGSEALWGSGPTWGGEGDGSWEGQVNIFEARVFPARQKCETFQLTISEVFNNSFGVVAGAGLTLSGINLVAGMKRGMRTSKSSRNFG